MIDQESLTEWSRHALTQDIRVLQGYRFAQTEREHIAKLLEHMKPEHGSVWLDIGCGFGEPAKLMSELRPDLTFCLINNNKFQLEQVPEGQARWYADMHALPFEDETADGAMFLYSLCHADDPIQAIREARRVVKPGGRLFVFDYMTNRRDHLNCPVLASQFFSFKAWQRMCRSVGWQIDSYVVPPGDDALFRMVMDNDVLYDHIFGELTPIVWWASRR